MNRKAVLSVGVLVGLVFSGIAVGFALQKEVTVSFNDERDEVTTNTWGGTLEEALAKTDLDVEELKAKYEPSIPWDQAITEDVQVSMTRIYQLTLVDAGHRTQHETKKFTVAGFFVEKGLALDELDEVNVPLTSRIKDDMTIIIDRIEEKVKTEKEDIPFDTVKKEDADLEKGKSILAQEGKTGQKVTEITYTYKNGALIDKDEEVVDKKNPVDKIVKVGTKEKPKAQKTKKDQGVKLASRSNTPAPPKKSKKRPAENVWDRLAACESGGNWSANTGNGYYGGLQFSLDTWRNWGGSGYPHEHSREAQIAVAKKLQAAEGWSAWPTCSEALGLR